jgi:hypothetical protein
VVIQQVENYVLVPRILGGSVGVHPAVILVGVMVFAVRFGILGAFVATPVLATLLIWFKYYHAHILGKEPYPEIATTETETVPNSHSPPAEKTTDAVEAGIIPQIPPAKTTPEVKESAGTDRLDKNDLSQSAVLSPELTNAETESQPDTHAPLDSCRPSNDKIQLSDTLRVDTAPEQPDQEDPPQNHVPSTELAKERQDDDTHIANSADTSI